MKYLYSWLLCCVLILSSCVSVLQKKTSSSPATSLSLVVKKNIYVTDQRMLRPVFGEGEASEQMYRFFMLNLPKVLKDSSTFDTILVGSGADRAHLKPTNLSWRQKRELTFELPSQAGDAPPFDTTDCTLFLQDISLYGKTLFEYNLIFIGSGSFNIRPLACYVLYTLWDNRKKKPITWGKISIGKKMAVNQCDWVEILHEISGRILTGSTYKKRAVHQASPSNVDAFTPRIKDCTIIK